MRGDDIHRNFGGGKIISYVECRESPKINSDLTVQSLAHEITIITMTNRVISNDDSNGDYNRPRRPNADTLSYLRSLPLHEKTAYEEIEAHFEIIRQQQNIHSDEHEETDEQDFPQILSAAVSAVEEVQNEIASLAGDEFGSQSIESIVRIVGPHSQLCSRKLLFGISGYLLHLSTHRVSSAIYVRQIYCYFDISLSIHHKIRKFWGFLSFFFF